MITVLIFLLGLGLCAWLIQSSRSAQRRQRARVTLRNDRARRLSRSLEVQIEEPNYPALEKPSYRQQRSRNENSPAFHAVLRELRFTHFWKSEAWRWEEAHRRMRDTNK